MGEQWAQLWTRPHPGIWHSRTSIIGLGSLWNWVSPFKMLPLLVKYCTSPHVFWRLERTSVIICFCVPPYSFFAGFLEAELTTSQGKVVATGKHTKFMEAPSAKLWLVLKVLRHLCIAVNSQQSMDISISEQHRPFVGTCLACSTQWENCLGITKSIPLEFLLVGNISASHSGHIAPKISCFVSTVEAFRNCLTLFGDHFCSDCTRHLEAWKLMSPTKARHEPGFSKYSLHVASLEWSC